jgi:hypothetical protein
VGNPTYIKQLLDAWIRIDELNNATFANLPGPGYKSLNALNTGVPLEMAKDTNLLSNTDGFTVRTSEQKIAAQAYCDAIKNHGDFCPASVLKKSAQSLASKENIPITLSVRTKQPCRA